MNIRSLVSQKDAVSAYLSLIRPVVLCLTETWLDNTITDNDISFFEYHVPWRLDRNRHGGGCAIYVRTDFHAVRLIEFEEATFEIHAIRLTLMNQQHVTILNIYRPKATTMQRLLARLSTILDEFGKSKYKDDILLCVGDLNAHFQPWAKSTVPSTKEGILLDEFLESMNFSQLVSGVTCVASETCLDLVITMNSLFVKNVLIECKLKVIN
ncbi:unnamed protein product [Didymodactylos carnosus]|uniref:Endonuclease/exonuclease/phosphatase domain-containing protein n=1 Tax=Didymodactylos carnosus TaxID=1234261 RepID=A0A8S2EG76_9BILA|nr:unnamed protein product [Didymodactylos carnosus]CAF3925196.1 unnamed protein product [Didymodactylos carnosus]